MWTFFLVSATMHSMMEGEGGSEPQDVFVELGTLIVEGRVPGGGNARGYCEGPHCSPHGLHNATSHHLCNPQQNFLVCKWLDWKFVFENILYVTMYIIQKATLICVIIYLFSANELKTSRNICSWCFKTTSLCALRLFCAQTVHVVLKRPSVQKLASFHLPLIYYLNNGP